MPADARTADKIAVLTLPHVKPQPKRRIMMEDVTALRDIPALTVSPDGRRYAILIRQGDWRLNDYRAGWFVGPTRGGALTFVGDAGEIRPVVRASGGEGQLATGEARWSPDARWIAYVVRRDSQAQLWKSSFDGRESQQLTHNLADVIDFAWSQDGLRLLFTVDRTREQLRLLDESRRRDGYNYDEDLLRFDALMSQTLHEPRLANPDIWMVRADGSDEHRADNDVRSAFTAARSRANGFVAAVLDATASIAQEALPFSVTGRGGDWVWLRKLRANSLRTQVQVLRQSGVPEDCPAQECAGFISAVWWNQARTGLYFLRLEGINNQQNAFYSWRPKNDRASLVLRTLDDDLRLCRPVEGDRVICVRETPVRAAHVVTIDLRSGKLDEIADANPEFRNIALGRVERFEWDTPRFSWNTSDPKTATFYYPLRAYGYILYPPDFDPSRKYPVFVDPYVANGFNRPGAEHAIHVYAANGFVVVNTEFPVSYDKEERVGADLMAWSYSAALGFPHLTMLMESTMAGLDVAIARGFLDTSRIAIGGVSHGTFVPLFAMQRYDRFAAASISSPHWGPLQYYWPTRRGRNLGNSVAWAPPPDGNENYWSKLDAAQHIDEMEAPLLMHLADRESFSLIRLIRNLDEASKPYDAFVFRDETHVKWQPAHLHAIRSRNLDWFRFWLQDIEDPDAAKAEQYARWRRLRELQCRNPRSLRDYCSVVSRQIPIVQ